MGDIEYLFKSSLFEFLKNLLFCVRDGCFKFNRFFKIATLYWKVPFLKKKGLNLNHRHGRKIIDFSKIQIMTFTIDIRALSCHKAKNLMNKWKSYWYTKSRWPFFVVTRYIQIHYVTFLHGVLHLVNSGIIEVTYVLTNYSHT